MIGIHLIFGAYGFWLPNDPRGSWSSFVGSYDLHRYGPATKVATKNSLASRRHDVHLRLVAKKALKRPAVRFNGMQARAIGRGLASYVAKSGTAVWACAILPDHVHLVLGARRLSGHQLAVQVKGAATRQLTAEGIHPFRTEATRRPSRCFARGEWCVFLDAEEEVRRAIRYVEENPLKEGLPPQHWSAVTPFEQNNR